MDTSSNNLKRVETLAHGYCDGTLDEGHFQELELLLSSSNEAKQRYMEIVQVWTELMDWAETFEPQQKPVPGQAPLISLPFPGPLNLGLMLGSIAALLCLVFYIGATWGSGSRDSGNQIAQQQRQNVGSSPSEPMVITPVVLGGYVARVVEVSEDATWGEAVPREFLLRLTKDERLDLRTGYARIEFTSGASVILHGPASFETLAGDMGRLVSGRLSGRAANGNFTLLTPNAEVIDLGTEFGVSIDDLSNTDVCVFDGEVDVNVVSPSGQPEINDALRLTEGMAVRLGPNGAVNDAADVRRSDFVRQLSREAIGEGDDHRISLVDIVAGGDGRRQRLAGAIDPRTGQWATEVPLDPEANRYISSGGNYTVCSTSPLIDGVFTPTAEGAEVQIDSSRATFNFGANYGATWGPIWSRRHAPGLPVHAEKGNDFWGTQTLDGILKVVEESRYGIVGLHSNAGLTIDLRAVRMLEGQAVAKFTTEVENLDNSASRPPQFAIDYRPSVDFWILVDGQLKYDLRDFGKDGGRVAVDIALGPNDRFLTLVSTDAGNSYSFDHLVLIDPELLIETP